MNLPGSKRGLGQGAQARPDVDRTGRRAVKAAPSVRRRRWGIAGGYDEVPFRYGWSSWGRDIPVFGGRFQDAHMIEIIMRQNDRGEQAASAEARPCSGANVRG